MTRYFCKLASTLMVFGLAMSLPASAQLSSQGGPIQVNGNVEEILNRENKVVFSGGVEVLQGDVRLTANAMTISFADGEGEDDTLGGVFGDIVEIVATGDVFYITPDQKARGDKAVYLDEDETIVLSGKVIVTIGEDVARTDCLIIDQKNDSSRLGCTPGATTVIITPDEDQ